MFRVSREAGQAWSTDGVIEHWNRLYHGNPMVDLYLRGQIKDECRLQRIEEYAGQWRHAYMTLAGLCTT